MLNKWNQPWVLNSCWHSGAFPLELQVKEGCDGVYYYRLLILGEIEEQGQGTDLHNAKQQAELAASMHYDSLLDIEPEDLGWDDSVAIRCLEKFLEPVESTKSDLVKQWAEQANIKCVDVPAHVMEPNDLLGVAQFRPLTPSEQEECDSIVSELCIESILTPNQSALIDHITQAMYYDYDWPQELANKICILAHKDMNVYKSVLEWNVYIDYEMKSEEEKVAIDILNMTNGQH